MPWGLHGFVCMCVQGLGRYCMHLTLFCNYLIHSLPTHVHKSIISHRLRDFPRKILILNFYYLVVPISS